MIDVKAIKEFKRYSELNPSFCISQTQWLHNHTGKLNCEMKASLFCTLNGPKNISASASLGFNSRDEITAEDYKRAYDLAVKEYDEKIVSYLMSGTNVFYKGLPAFTFGPVRSGLVAITPCNEDGEGSGDYPSVSFYVCPSELTIRED